MFAADDKDGEWYAVKRQLANDQEARNAILKEITFLRQVGVYPFLDAAIFSLCHSTLHDKF